MWRWLTDLWDRTNRRSDMSILWPVCRDTAGTVDEAKAAFMFHIANDPSWHRHYTLDELAHFVDDLGGR